MSKIYNLKKSSIDQRDFKHNLTENITLKISHFLTDVQMLTCPILDQGNIGSCLAHALYALMYITSKSKVRLSRLHLYLCIRGTDLSGLSYDEGGTIRGGLQAIKNYGVCAENLWTYDTSKFDQLSPSKCFRAIYPIKNYVYTFIPQIELNIKNCLASGKPIVLGILVYDSFDSTNASTYGVISYPDKTKEQLLGGHAILLVGYDDTKKVFKFQNSWGITWGDKGYGYIPYNYILDNTLAFDLVTMTFII